MTSVSIFCVSRDVELVLDALSSFGEFHVEQAEENLTLAQFSQSILQAEEIVATINELSAKIITKNSSIFDIFKVEQPLSIHVTSENWQTLQEDIRKQIIALKSEIDGLSSSMSSLVNETRKLNHIKNMLQTIDKMSIDLTVMEDMKLITIEIAAVPHKNISHLQAALSSYPVIIQKCYLTKEIDFVYFALPSKNRMSIEKILKTHHSEIFQIPKELPHDVSLALEKVNSQLTSLKQKQEKVLLGLKELSRENHDKIVSWKEITENILVMLKTERKILKSGRLSRIKGFVPKKKLPELTQKVNADLKGNVLVIENEPAPKADPPTLISHNRFVKPFEEITKLYGLPHYDELDPTPIIAITFPLIFGLMFGDIGHGLLFLVGGLAVGTLIKKGQAIKNVCFIMAACGVGAIIAGALFGEFFGKQIFAPLWFSPFDNVLKFLIFTLFVGVAQIISGLALEMINFLLKHNLADALLTSVPKIAFYVGAIYLVAIYQLNFEAWFKGPILLTIVPFLVLVFGKPIFVVADRLFGRAVETQSDKGSFGQRIFESGDFVTRLLSNTISYTRILALLMAHWALVVVVYTVVGQIGTASILTSIISGIIVIAGNIFVLALEGLIVFIHTMRLHFYEWFTKFFMGTGTEFTPFRQEFFCTQVELTGKEPQKKS